jgi:hypothetical protein
LGPPLTLLEQNHVQKFTAGTAKYGISRPLIVQKIKKKAVFEIFGSCCGKWPALFVILSEAKNLALRDPSLRSGRQFGQPDLSAAGTICVGSA